MSGSAAIRCQMFCDEPVGPDGDPGSDDWKACCPDCQQALRVVCKQILPAVRRQGYWVPEGSSVELELAAMQEQADLRPAAAALLSDLLGSDVAAAVGWTPERDQAGGAQ